MGGRGQARPIAEEQQEEEGCLGLIGGHTGRGQSSPAPQESDTRGTGVVGPSWGGADHPCMTVNCRKGSSRLMRRVQGEGTSEGMWVACWERAFLRDR